CQSKRCIVSSQQPNQGRYPESCRLYSETYYESSIMRCIHILIQGIVQGVGFRPFLHRLAETHQIYGWVRNTSVGLEGILEGENDALKQFLLELDTSPPPLSFIENIDIFPIKNFVRYTEFTIR